MMKVLTIIGARPQIIKAAAISRAIRTKFADQIQEKILHTGQHYDENMSGVFFDELGIPQPDYNLHVGSGKHGEQTAKMISGIEEVLLAEHFDGVIVYGDTNSTLAAAVAAGKLHVPIYHVEAGLRSFNMAMPEEQNRIVCDHLSTILFAPTQTAVENLEREGMIGAAASSLEAERLIGGEAECGVWSVECGETLDTKHQTPDTRHQTLGGEADRRIGGEERVFKDGRHQRVVMAGDVMYDNALYFSAMAEERLRGGEADRRIGGEAERQIGGEAEGFILVTIHRDNNTDDPRRLEAIIRALVTIADEGHDIVLPLHPRTRKLLPENLPANLYEQLITHEHIHIQPPASFFEILMLEKHAEVVMTDSGGVQKEAFFFETPCVILRPETEWVEIVNAGAGILADADYDRILAAYRHLSGKKVQFPPLFGDGHAAERVVEAILKESN